MSAPQRTICERRRSAAITATSVICSLGDSAANALAAIRSGARGFTKNHRFAEWSDAMLGEIPEGLLPITSTVGATSDDSRLSGLVARSINQLDRQTNLFARYAPSRIAFVFGTTTAGGDALQELLFHSFDHPETRLARELGESHQLACVESLVRRLFPIQGPFLTIATACSSSANALAEGLFLLRSGACDACVAGGMDTLSLATLCGFDALQVLDHHGSRPFHRDRAGMTLAEGGALLLLEARPETPPLAWLSGAGASSDAYHITQPDPSGRGMTSCMRAALEDAGLGTNAIGYINAHGTGTRLNDEVEAKSINAVFGARVPVSSTKGFHGHTLGGAGALEAALCVEALRLNTTIPGLRGDIEYPELIHLIDSTESAGGAARVDHVMSNSFGFGGSNASIVISHPEATR